MEKTMIATHETTANSVESVVTTAPSAYSAWPTAPAANRPTVCHVIHALGVGGAEMLVDVMLRQLSGEYRGIVAVLDGVGEIGDQLAQDGFHVEHLHRAPGLDHSCSRRLADLVERENVTLLHAHQYTPFFQCLLGRGFTGRTPILFTEHGRHYPDHPSRKRTVFNRLMLKTQDQLIACGGAVRRALIDNEGLPEQRVDIVYNGVDLNTMGAAPTGARENVRREFGIGAEEVLAVQIARLHELKDHDTAIRAIETARRAFPSLRLLLVGDGDQRSAIEASIAARGLQEHVILAGTRRDVSSLLAAADMFLLTSISEGIPLTVIEAMAAHLPVVATAVGGVPEMVDEGVTGFLTNEGDDKTLAARIVRLASDPAERRTMGTAGRKKADRQFSLHSMMEAYRGLYREMVIR